MIYGFGALYEVQILRTEAVESEQQHRYVGKQGPVGTNYRPDSIDTIGNNWTNTNGGFRGIDDYGSGICRFQALRVISHATCKEPSVC